MLNAAELRELVSPSASYAEITRQCGLTRRELQVVRLVGRLQTNREIATTLFISVRTAESHVEHILTKLNLGSRTELAAWARANGLLEGDGTEVR